MKRAKKLKLNKDYSKTKWLKLPPRERYLRILSLKVLSEMREGVSLTRASREVGLDIETVKSHIKSAIRKRRGRWVAKKTDKIQRALVINEKGRSREIVVRNSMDASLIGEYHNAVKRLLEARDPSMLKRFKRRVIEDVKGRKHKLETDPKVLFEIAEAREEEEFFEIYGD